MLSGLMIMLSVLISVLQSIDLTPQVTRYVFEDEGGSIRDRIAEIDRHRANDDIIKVLGVCKSSCAMYLGYENTCVSADSEFWFHSAVAWKKGTEEVEHNPARVAGLNKLIADQYPPFVAERFLDEWQYNVGKEFAKVKGQWFIDHGIAEC